MKSLLRVAFALAAAAIAPQALASVTFYEQENFGGRSVTTVQPVNNLQRAGFNDRASSAVVTSERWEACEAPRFGGRCIILRPGRYPSLAAMGLNDRITSVRSIAREARIDDSRYAPLPVVAQITFYEQEGFAGRTFVTEQNAADLGRAGFNDRASSAVVSGERFEICENVRFGGRCMVLRPGRYPSLTSMGLNDRVSSVRVVSPDMRVDERRYAAMPVDSQVTFYERENFGGRSFGSTEPVVNLQRYGYNDAASSVVVAGRNWEVCDDARFEGRCVVLRPGRYPSLASMGLNNRISSLREQGVPADDRRSAPVAVDAVYQVPVTSVRAVVSAPQGQRCWMERAEVAPDNNKKIPGAVVGAILGGILGHQIGGGKGQDIATAGGAIAGGVLGANVGGRAGASAPQEVQKCENVSNPTPEYWDVTYTFRGIDHRVQMSAPPGPTINVNERGEPRA